MARASRREVLRGVAAVLAACRTRDPIDTGGGVTDGMSFEGIVPFIDEEARTLDALTGEGLDGRLITDVSTLDEDGLIQENDRFYVRTAASALLDTSGWSVTIGEEVVGIDALRDLAAPQGVVQFECSGNGSFGGFGLMSAAEWDGVPIADLLAALPGDRVRISGFDSYPAGSETSAAGASWVFLRSDLAAAGAFLATGMNGEDLPLDHGFPVRLVVPGWYGCANIKWVQEIALVDEDEPATGQMIEFAGRTHQVGEPALARDYLPAIIDVAAVALRVEKWRTEDGAAVYRVVGVTWGGPVPADFLRIHLGDAEQVVEVAPPRPDGRTWSLWETLWSPEQTGEQAIAATVDDPAIRTRRLDTGYYTRTVVIDEVGGRG
jgi:DMSO/TMAO reductase YedYZ molybdopterin-dependent catalytic subunit